ncbi:hypothetical protein [Acidicapsa acidisoli]|uniref:hypothetical protein n=1 Tax=Acidicapsa acidisoli TaxID=1615681 RepID=UPI0021DF9322|nr:hypothetical protein [Acidicapsa acidisoli]
MNITTNTHRIINANRCIGRMLVNKTVRRGATKNFYIAFVLCAMGLAHGALFVQANQASVGLQSPAVSPAPSGQHDFDFHFGSWKAHNRILLHPLSGSTAWIELDGTVTVQKIWDGRANLEEIESGNTATHFQGLSLFLYNPASHQWSQTFVNSDDGTLGQPLIGEFKNERGEFFGRELLQGRSILVRFVWSDIRPDSHRVEQSYSDDGGKTWEPNFVATLTRVNK